MDEARDDSFSSELLEARAILRALLSTTTDAVIALDGDSQLLMANEAGNSLLRLLSQEEDESCPAERMSSHLPDVSPDIERALRGDSNGQWRRIAVDRPGSSEPAMFDLRVSPVVVGGSVRGVLLLAKDVSDLVRIERHLDARDKTLAALNTITATVGWSADARQTLDRMLSQALRILGVDAGLLSLLDERGKQAEIVCEGVARASVRDFHRMVLSRFTDGKGLQSVVIGDLSENHQFGVAALKDQGIRSLACVPLRSKSRLVGVLGLLSRCDNYFASEDIDVLMSIANQLAVVIDNARLYQGLTERIKETEVLYEVGRTLISTLDHDEVLQQILKVVQESFGYTRCGILLIDEEKGELYVKAAYGHAPQVTKEIRLKVGHEGITGLVASTGRPLNVPDVSRDPRYVPGPSPAASELALPLKIGTQIIGVLDVQSNKIAAFGERDLRILSSFADQAAIAIENARLYDRTRQMGVIEERNRLAREIHDVLAQNLTGTIVQLEAADSLLVKGNYAKAQEVLRKAMEQARESLQEARRSIAGLRAAPLEYLPLSQVLASELKAFKQETGIDTSYQFKGDDALLSPDVSMALYRISKEGLSNVHRHASASNVGIILDVEPQRCVLTIQDDGVGFDPMKKMSYVNGANKGFGLIGMRERARLLGGTMSIESNIGAGTRIKVEVPLKVGRSSGGGMPQ